LKKYGTATVINVNASGKATDVELATSDGQVEKNACPAFDTQVSIRITSYRCRLADVDGISGKAVLDALVLAGVIANDTTKEVSEVLFPQVKVKTKAEEKTVVTITANRVVYAES